MESEFAVYVNMVTNAGAAQGGRRVKPKVVPLSVGKCVNGSTHLSSAHAILLSAARIWAFVMSHPVNKWLPKAYTQAFVIIDRYRHAMVENKVILEH